MTTIQLILNERAPVCALVPPGVTDLQLDIIYTLLGWQKRVYCHPELSARWSNGQPDVQTKPSYSPVPFCRVLCNDEFAATQLARVPCTPPKNTIKLAFL